MTGLFKKLFGNHTAVDFKALQAQGAVIVDVRTPGEFSGGHIRGAVNIPLDLLRTKTAELKKKQKPIITCCRSGARSGMAVSILKGAGIECYNGGAWDSLSGKLS
ncbi:MAG: rhodanese-like domain-containing protein [Chitinophagaceae bacterium]|nr:rhodanese-like domain-containing protein [Chitinophagaceae bacterium]